MDTQKTETKSVQDRRAERHKDIVFLSGRIYGISKIVVEILAAFGSELDETATDIKFHIDQVESAMVQNSSRNLLAATEDMFYVVYAILKTEITNIELCQSFHFDIRKGRILDESLPAPKHLKQIFQACQDLLKAKEIEGLLNKELIRQEQADYANKMVKFATETGYYYKDTSAYRQHVLSLACDPKSPHYKKWKGLNPVRDAAPGMMLATLSEKYRGSLHGDSKLATDAGDRDCQEWRHIMANREAAYAMLHDIPVGEHRRTDGQLDFYEYIGQKLCVCFSFCSCAKRCTDRSHRACPCTARTGLECGMNTADLKDCFSERCSDGAAIIFGKISDASRSSSRAELAAVLASGVNAFPDEVASYRELHEHWVMCL